MDAEKPRRRPIRKIIASILGLYALWSLWTGRLGPDTVQPFGPSIVGGTIATMMAETQVEKARREGRAALVAMLQEPIPSSLRRPAVGGRDPDVASGGRLPRERAEIGEILIREDPYLQYDLQFVIRNSCESFYMTRFWRVGTVLWDEDAAELIRWYAAQADELPPRRIDTLLYRSAWMAGNGDTNRASWRTEADSWRRMAFGRNPYYRMLALGTAHRWAKDWTDRRVVYLRALDERDPAIVEYALACIKRAGEPDQEIFEKVQGMLEGARSSGDSKRAAEYASFLDRLKQ